MTVTGGLLLAGLALVLLRALLLCRRWRAGQPASVDWRTGLARLPRAYLRDVHDIVARQPRAAQMHMCVAGGLVGVSALAFIRHILGLGGAAFAYLLLAALAVLCIGIGLVLRRRWPRRAAHLSGGRFQTLPVALASFALFLIGGTLPLAGWSYPEPVFWFVAAVGIISAAWLSDMVARGPLRHAVAGALHLIAHPRPSRFGQPQPSAALSPLDLDAARLGVETAADFAWNRLLGFDACVQCGRCELVCPAFAAGQPLNPKKLIQDLANSLTPAGSVLEYAGSPHPGRHPDPHSLGPSAPLVGGAIAPETLWACTTCRSCVQECPMMIEHVDAVIDLRRFQVLENGNVPGKGAAALAELRATDNPGGRPAVARVEWAVDLALPVISGDVEVDFLLWLGDGAFELRNQRTLRALVKLLRIAGVDFAVLGEVELDCGDVARRLGEEAIFQHLARRNVELLSRFRFRRILTVDPHVLNCLRNEYPAFGGVYDVVHHTALLDELIAGGRLEPRTNPHNRVTYHDPCYLGRYNGELQAPRAILTALGGNLIEMQRSGMNARCCGGGGGASLTDIPGRQRIPDIRMNDARATAADVVAVACPNCALMLEGVTGQRPDVRDVAELLLEAVEPR